MAIKSYHSGNYIPPSNKEGEICNIFENFIIDTIKKKISPQRRVITKNQICHHIKKIAIYLDKQLDYIQLIKDLIEFEMKTNGVKK